MKTHSRPGAVKSAERKPNGTHVASTKASAARPLKFFFDRRINKTNDTTRPHIRTVPTARPIPPYAVVVSSSKTYLLAFVFSPLRKSNSKCRNGTLTAKTVFRRTDVFPNNNISVKKYLESQTKHIMPS